MTVNGSGCQPRVAAATIGANVSLDMGREYQPERWPKRGDLSAGPGTSEDSSEFWDQSGVAVDEGHRG